MPTPTRPSRSLRPLASQAMFALTLGAAVALPLVGCKKPEAPTNTQPVPTSTKIDLTPEEGDIVREIAKQRREQRLAEAPPFDRDAEIRRLLLEEYEVDLDARFPDGIDRQSLRDRAAIAADVQTRVLADADIRYPAEKREQLIKEAELKFPIRTIGEHVKVNLRGGRKVEGDILAIGPDHAKIGVHTILFADVLEPDPVSFDEERSEGRRVQYVKVNFDTDRELFIDEQTRKLLPATLKQHGFVPAAGKLVRIDALIDSLESKVDKAEQADRKSVV